jgi:hypothetical protein
MKTRRPDLVAQSFKELRDFCAVNTVEPITVCKASYKRLFRVMLTPRTLCLPLSAGSRIAFVNSLRTQLPQLMMI